MNQELAEQITAIRRTHIKELQAMRSRMDQLAQKIEEIKKTYDEHEQILSMKEAAAFLGYSEGYFRQWYLNSNIPCRQVGGRIKFYRSDLHKWITEHTEKNAASAVSS